MWGKGALQYKVKMYNFSDNIAEKKKCEGPKFLKLTKLLWIVKAYTYSRFSHKLH